MAHEKSLKHIQEYLKFGGSIRLCFHIEKNVLTESKDKKSTKQKNGNNMLLSNERINVRTLWGCNTHPSVGVEL